MITSGRVNFTTEARLGQTKNFAFAVLGVGIHFHSIALGINFCETSLIFNLTTRLGGEICLCDVNMHRSYSLRTHDCNGVTACVTSLVTLIVCILGVVILEPAMLYQNVGSNGRQQ